MTCIPADGRGADRNASVRGRRLNGLTALAAATLLLAAAGPAHAHGFTLPYDLPIPLWLYLAGAGAVVAVSFAVMAMFFGAAPGLGGYPRLNLLRFGLGRALAHPYTLGLCRLASFAVFVLIVVAGLIGNQSPFKNIAPTLVWVIWWVGGAYVSALVGDVWALLNPWKIGFAWAEALYRRLNPGRELSLGRPYPRRLGAWPGVLLFFAFAWIELVWDGGEIPRNLALLVLAYSAITWTGMFVFGRERWLKQGEAFALAFGLLARFAPLEVRVAKPGLCESCPAAPCAERDGACVNCYACFGRAEPADREWNLRPYAVGLLGHGPVSLSMMAFVLVMLSTVTFDGLTETSAWVDFMGLLNSLLGLDLAPGARSSLSGAASTVVLSLALAAFAALFLVAFLLFGRLMGFAMRAGPRGAIGRFTPTELARVFVLTLIPIALAYHLAHYLSFLLIAGQLVIPLASDPFGMGWNLFHTTHYRIDINIVNAKFVWYTAVATIVTGHMLAVYLAHVMALRVIGRHRAALQSQAPMLALMVGYTMISLWILAQPVVASP